jgi:hypothetical protein
MCLSREMDTVSVVGTSYRNAHCHILDDRLPVVKLDRDRELHFSSFSDLGSSSPCIVFFHIHFHIHVHVYIHRVTFSKMGKMGDVCLH